ncbi:hypothetical protein RHGRI_004371 [Rhododendron griersonianum]|uniref:Uncharacterized protein n=1 Tax=Rhododendron griersonianum TaxID=479676 RepID=A0AAV6LAF2_9ERIC|nr:hypothetical protein RHGRI_004371 [Rhododendron griersonianum]
MEIIYVVELVSPLGEWRQDGNNLRDGVNHEENPPLPTSSGISLSTQLPPPGSGDHLLQPPLETKLLEGKVYGSLARAGKVLRNFAVWTDWLIWIAWLGGYSGVLKLQVGLRISEHSAISSSHGNKAFLDGSDLNSRHVKHLQ